MKLRSVYLSQIFYLLKINVNCILRSQRLPWPNLDFSMWLQHIQNVLSA